MTDREPSDQAKEINMPDTGEYYLTLIGLCKGRDPLTENRAQNIVTRENLIGYHLCDDCGQFHLGLSEHWGQEAQPGTQ